MNKDNYIYLGIISVVVLVVIGINFSFDNHTEKNTITENSEFPEVFTGTTQSGDVRIDIIPIEVSNNELKIELSANTHTVDLSQFNLKEITTLNYNGKSINPISSSGLSGHHSSMILTFNTDSKPDKFNIKIIGIPLTEERVFEWD